MDIARIPSPEEIEQYKTPNGGWTRHDLANWGVPWPPPEGWKEALEGAYQSGQTVGIVLECIGCRKAKYFVDYDPYPVCRDCQKWEDERYGQRLVEEETYTAARRDAQRRRMETRVRQEVVRVQRSAGAASSRNPVIGFVYLIRIESGLYKIGKAKDMAKRLQPFSVLFPMKWELVYQFKSNDYSAAEARLHNKFAEKRDIGEWFRLTADDVEYIKGIKDNQL
jgi:hypothetical protein